MGWDKVQAAGRKAVKMRVTMAVRNDANPVMVVAVGQELMHAAGLEISGRVAVLWGNGSHNGWLRLQPDESGFKLRPSGKSIGAACVLSTSQFHQSARKQAHPAQECRWRVVDGGLEIQPPNCFWADVPPARGRGQKRNGHAVEDARLIG